MIEIVDITKKFDDKVIFNDFSMTIHSGEFVVFAGNSGCGKTTLLNMIGGLEKPNSGKIIVDGEDIYSRKRKDAYYLNKIGFLFQNFALVENESVRKNLAYVQEKGRSGLSIEEAVEKVGLLQDIDTKVYKLSGGEQQRVALARLMYKKCDIILADEPTGSLDVNNANMVIDFLHELNVQGKTIILVTHNEDIIKKERKVVWL